jgi:hypothetical protein
MTILIRLVMYWQGFNCERSQPTRYSSFYVWKPTTHRGAQRVSDEQSSRRSAHKVPCVYYQGAFRTLSIADAIMA